MEAQISTAEGLSYRAHTSTSGMSTPGSKRLQAVIRWSLLGSEYKLTLDSGLTVKYLKPFDLTHSTYCSFLVAIESKKRKMHRVNPTPVCSQLYSSVSRKH